MVVEIFCQLSCAKFKTNQLSYLIFILHPCIFENMQNISRQILPFLEWKVRNFVCISVLKVSLCTPSENTPTESLARLVSMVFQWFHSTAYMMDDEVGSLVEKLKPQFVTKWLKTVCDVRFDVMVMCLLPKPMEFARVRIIYLKVCLVATDLKVNWIKTVFPPQPYQERRNLIGKGVVEFRNFSSS